LPFRGEKILAAGYREGRKKTRRKRSKEKKGGGGTGGDSLPEGQKVQDFIGVGGAPVKKITKNDKGTERRHRRRETTSKQMPVS